MSLEGLGVRVPLCSLNPYLFFFLNIQVTYFISDSEAWPWMDRASPGLMLEFTHNYHHLLLESKRSNDCLETSGLSW